VKRLGVLALVAAAAVTLTASRSEAAPTSTLPSSISSILASSGVNLNSIFNGAARTATSVSVTSDFGSLMILNPKAPEVSLQTGDILFGKHNKQVIIRIAPYREAPPSSRPIPEGRSVLLYALGALAIGWAVLRSRRTASSHAA
jgi:hypothetical protein